MRAAGLFAARVFLIVATLLSPAWAEVTDEALQSAVDRTNALATRALKQSGIPGMFVVIVHRDKVVFLRTWGVREAGTNLRVTPNTRFQVASVSKPITSTVLAGLVGDGVINWDDPIIQHDPTFALSTPFATQNVTFRDLLTHTSGLPGHAGDLLEDLGANRQTILRRLWKFPIGDGFRTKYAYTNYGITEAGVAAGLAAGLRWEDLISSRLFAELGMTSTSASYADFLNGEHALPHVPARADWVPNGKWVSRYRRNPNPQSPAGGVSTTPGDLARWMILHLNDGQFEGRQVIAADAIRETHQPPGADTPNPSYGLCWIVQDVDGRRFLRHSGEFTLGVRSAVALCLEEQIGVAVVVNASVNGLPEGIERSFYDYLLQGELTRDWVAFANEQFEKDTLKGLSGDGTDYSKPPRPVRPPGDLRGLVGRYHNRVYGTARVVQRGNRLVMRLGPKGVQFPLRHFDGRVFYFQTKGEMASGTSGAIFRGSNGRGRSLTLNAYNGNRLGVFRR